MCSLGLLGLIPKIEKEISLKITVIGSGYVGLVTGACFADMGNHVTCVDIDERKLESLRAGKVPIYEPGLETIIHQAQHMGFMSFTSDLAQALKGSDVAFIAVGTPPHEDGSADLQYVLAVADQIGKTMSDYLVVVDKSTVPVGTADKVTAAIKNALESRGSDLAFDVVSNPEFLKEGAAIDDFMKPDRIVIGTESERAEQVMRELYAPFSRNHDKMIVMGVRDAEMTKYAANAMLATKISFINEVASLCEQLGVDVEQVRRGIGADQRIGHSFIYPGCGYGGSCFPKDVKALIRMGKDVDFEPSILDAVQSRNEAQKERLFEKIAAHFGQLAGKRIAIWGLAFKPGTDDMREAPSIVLIQRLLAAGAEVAVFDPVASETAAQAFAAEHLDSSKIHFYNAPYETLAGADALALVTEWKLFRQPDFKQIANALTSPVLFDGRNQYSPEYVRSLGFHYEGIGR